MPTVQVLCDGIVVRDGPRIVDASSTVTLVRMGESLIVVDTGARSRSEMLVTALAAADVRPEEVDALVNTHLHTDHCGCNEMFANAVKFAHPREDSPIGTIAAVEGTAIGEGVTVIETPGHTEGSITVLVEAEARYAICGDALPTKANYESHTPPAVHVDRRLAVLGMERVISVADVVVPGHDAPFRVIGKK
ncbi:TPA: MBL fold metallo-hydrolase [Thermoplasmata archaeon]|nr:MBL fold metallo-hydrolase [Thermoplasmata archaeon]